MRKQWLYYRHKELSDITNSAKREMIKRYCGEILCLLDKSLAYVISPVKGFNNYYWLDYWYNSGPLRNGDALRSWAVANGVPIVSTLRQVRCKINGDVSGINPDRWSWGPHGVPHGDMHRKEQSGCSQH